MKTIKDIAKEFEVTETSLIDWALEYPDPRESELLEIKNLVKGMVTDHE